MHPRSSKNYTVSIYINLMSSSKGRSSPSLDESLWSRSMPVFPKSQAVFSPSSARTPSTKHSFGAKTPTQSSRTRDSEASVSCFGARFLGQATGARFLLGPQHDSPVSWYQRDPDGLPSHILRKYSRELKSHQVLGDVAISTLEKSL